MFFRRWGPPGLLVALSAVVLSACGGGSGSTISQGQAAAREGMAMTDAQFTRRLNALCQEHIHLQLAASRKFTEEYGAARRGTPAELEAQLLAVIVPNVRTTIQRLERLRPPPAEEALLDELLRDLRRGVKASEADQSWIVHDIPEPFKPARRVGIRLGNMSCGEP